MSALSLLAVDRLTLSHFRSYKSLSLQLDGRPIAIYGLNGAGKTNILEAVSMLSPGRGFKRAGTEDMVRRPEALGWKIAAGLDSLGHSHEIETWVENGSNRQVRIDGKAAAQTALGRLARMVWLVPTMDRLWVDSAEGRRRFLDRMTLSFEPKHGEITLAYDKAMRERNRLLKDQVHNNSWYAALESQMSDLGAEIQRNRKAAIVKITAAQTDAKTAFPVADISLIAPADAECPNDADDLADVLQNNRIRDMAAGRSLIGPHRADLNAVYQTKGVAAKLCSTGEQKALLVSLVLANARALASETGAPPIILLDEVSAHLDVERRAALFDEICALNAQAWMTGTGAELFEGLEDRAYCLEVTEQNGESAVAERC